MGSRANWNIFISEHLNWDPARPSSGRHDAGLHEFWDRNRKICATRSEYGTESSNKNYFLLVFQPHCMFLILIKYGPEVWRKFNNSNMNSAMWKCLLDCVYPTLLVGISNWSCQKNIDEKSIFLLCWTRTVLSSECRNDSIILLINRYPIPASSPVYQHRYDPGCCVYIVHCPNHTPYGEGGGITSNHHCSSSHPSQSYLSGGCGDVISV